MVRVALVALTFASLTACHGGSSAASTTPAPPPLPSEHSLSGLAAQQVAVLPTYSIRVVPGLQWAIGRPEDAKRAMDAELLSAMEERGLRKAWLFPEELAASYRRNSSYASDPYALAEEPLRSPNLNGETRIPQPLASQIRTLVALHQDARLVLAPVELRFEKAGATTGRGILKVVFLDARMANVFWTGEFSSDTTSAFGPVIAATIASRLAAAVAP
jgi:hypothetical protein